MKYNAIINSITKSRRNTLIWTSVIFVQLIFFVLSNGLYAQQETTPAEINSAQTQSDPVIEVDKSAELFPSIITDDTDNKKPTDSLTDGNQKADNQKADEQKADEQKADEQKADEQKADEQKADEQKTDEQKADEQKTDSQKADDSPVETVPEVEETVLASQISSVPLPENGNSDSNSANLTRQFTELLRKEIPVVEYLSDRLIDTFLPAKVSAETSEKSAPKVIPLDKIPQDVTFPALPEKAATPQVVAATTVDGQTVLVKETPAEIEKTAVKEEPVKPLDANQIRVYEQITNPRALVSFFLESCSKRNFDDAVLAMDLSKMPDVDPMSKQMLAYRLAGILFRLKNLDLRKIPEKTAKTVYYMWPDPDYNAIVLQKQPDGAWKFGSATVAEINKFYEKIESRPPVYVQKGWLKYLPDSAFKAFLGISYLQWGFLTLYFLLGYVVYKIAPFISAHLIMVPLKIISKSGDYTVLVKRAIRPLAYLAMVYIWFIGLTTIHVSPAILQWASWIIHPFGILMLMISVIRLTDVFGEWLRNRMAKTNSKIGNVLVDLSTRTIKCLIAFLGMIGIAQVYGFSALGIISGMGIGGIAVALAAQQTISNFFGSLTILLDQPFTVGDWIVVDGVEGSVESIGLRSTRIRTFYNSLVVIPNSSLATSTIDNMGKRLYRRYKTFLGVQYDTPVELMEAFCGGVRALIESYPHTRKDDIRVCVNEFNSSSIDILLVCYFIVHSAEQENSARQQLILDIIRLANKLGVQFAFPSVTQYQIVQDAAKYPILEEMQGNQNPPARFGADIAKGILNR